MLGTSLPDGLHHTPLPVIQKTRFPPQPPPSSRQALNPVRSTRKGCPVPIVPADSQKALHPASLMPGSPLSLMDSHSARQLRVQRDCLNLFLSLKQMGEGGTPITIQMDVAGEVLWKCTTDDTSFTPPEVFGFPKTDGTDKLSISRALIKSPLRAHHRVPDPFANPWSPSMEAEMVAGQAKSTEHSKASGALLWQRDQPSRCAEEDQEPTSLEAAISHSMDDPAVALQSSDWNMLSIGGELTCVRTRAKKAFKKMTAMYCKEIDRHKTQAQDLERLLNAQRVGGSEYLRLTFERDALAKQIAELQEAQAGLRQQLEDFHEHQQKRERELLEAQQFKGPTDRQRVNWKLATTCVDWLIVDDRPDEHILQDIVQFILKLKEQNDELVSTNDELGYHLGQAEDLNVQMQEQVLALLSSQGDKEKARLQKDLKAQIELAQEAREAKDGRGMKLQHVLSTMAKPDAASTNIKVRQLMQQELELRSELDVLKGANHAGKGTKAEFIGLGMCLSVPPHLRWRGRLRNLNLQIGQVVTYIDELWRARYGSLYQPPATAVKNGLEILGQPRAQVRKAAKKIASNLSLQEVAREKEATLNDPPPYGGQFEEYSLIDYANIYPTNGSGAEELDFAEFVLGHFAANTASREGAFEKVYSLVDACRRFASNPECDMFLAVLNREVAEDVVWDRAAMLVKLKYALVREENHRNLDSHVVGKPKGILKCADFLRFLERFFPCKPPASLLALKQCLTLDLENPYLGMAAKRKGPNKAEPGPGSAGPSQYPDEPWLDEKMKYKTLFENGHNGRFLAELKRQHLQDVMTYASEVEAAVFSSAADGSISTLQAVKVAIRNLDPQKPPFHVDLALSSATQTQTDKLPWQKELRVATLAEHLKTVLQRALTPTRDKQFTLVAPAPLSRESTAPLSPTKVDTVPQVPKPSSKWGSLAASRAKLVQA